MNNPKPDACKGCPLYQKGHGYAQPVGDENSPIVLVGEALGFEEAKHSQPFIGPAGQYLDQTLNKLGMSRNSFRIANIVNCQPPNNWLANAPWEFGAITHCMKAHGPKWLGRHKVYVTLGAISTRSMIEMVNRKPMSMGKLDNWQATVTEWDDSYIVPTYHPSYLLRGYQNLQSTQLFAIRRAMELASFGRSQAPMDLVIDPSLWFLEEWIRGIDPEAWIAVDIETAAKLAASEDELDFVTKQQIVRINFASNTEQGITVEWAGRYADVIKRILLLPNPKIMWNARFDVPVLAAHDYGVNGTVLDFMLGWHVLQSRLPKGLGFVTPFYADIGPWKHLSGTEFEKYSAIDPIATLHCAYGIAKHLMNEDQWPAFQDHIVSLDRLALHPAEEIGLLLDAEQIKALSANIQVQLKLMDADLQAMIPKDLLPLAGGWKRQPKGDKYPNAFKKKVWEDVFVCTDCGEEDVTQRHKCPQS